MKIVVITGGFDPIHSGHIAYIQEAAKLGDRLMIGLNVKKVRPLCPGTNVLLCYKTSRAWTMF
jgi:D-beta-D-heptose 7-phosphate kinase/D-beta-D-heptose 1-phosphate adenosyltransferase